LSPRLRGRVDAPVYKQGLASCLNFNPTPQGSLLKAEGLRLVDAPTDATGFKRTISFKTSSLERFQVSLTHERIRVFGDSGVLGAFATEYISNGGCDANGAGWTFNGAAATFQGFNPDQYIEFANYGVDAFAKQTTPALPTGTYTLKLKVRKYTTASNIGTGLQVLIGTSDGGSQISATFYHAAGDVSVKFVLGAPTVVYVRVFRPAAVGGLVQIDDVSLRVQDAAALYAAAPWKDEDIPLVQFVAETGRDRMVFVHPLYQPQVLVWTPATKVWVLSPMFTGTGALGGTIPLAAPAHTVPEWSGSNWPAVVDYWQGRIWMAATPAKRNTFWASKPFSYDFTAANYAAMNAGDGFSYDAAVKGEIRWMQGQKVMLVGTDDGEFSISANDGVVYAGNLDIKQESSFGSAKVQALSVGDEVLFVSPDRKKLRAMKFSLEGGGWYARDITFTAEHITKPIIVDIAFARDPFNTIALCLSDGTLACCNYDRAEGLAGWWRRAFTGALAKSVSVMTSAQGDEVWVVAEVTDAAVRFLARWPLYETDNLKLDLQRTLNCVVTAPAGTLALNHATMVVTSSLSSTFTVGSGPMCVGTIVRFLGALGAWYGEIRITEILGTYTARFEVVNEWPLVADVAATTDWNYSTAILRFGNGWWNGVGEYAYPICAATDRVVVLEGNVLQRPYGAGNLVIDLPTDGYSVAVQNTAPDGMTPQEIRTYTVGLTFVAEATTLPMEGGNPAGSAQGFVIHRADITVRLNNSCLPQVNGATVEPSVNRFISGVGHADPLFYLRMAGDMFTEDATAKPQTRSHGGIVDITQELPWRTEVCALFGNAQMSKV
jgi:hypothetical protein